MISPASVDAPRPRSLRTSSITTGSQRSITDTPSFCATYSLACFSRIPPGDLHPGHQISSGPDPAHPRGYAVADRLAVDVARTDLQPVEAQNVDRRSGRPRRGVSGRQDVHGHATHAHAPVEVHGHGRLLAALLDDGDGARHVPGDRLARVDVDRRSEDRDPRLGRELHLFPRPEAGQPQTVVLELAVHAEHELTGHADLNAQVGEPGADALDGLEGHQAVSYTHLRAHETRHDLVCRLLLE